VVKMFEFKFKQSYLTKLMNDDMARKVNDIKTPTDDETEIEKYENSIADIKNQSVSYL